LDALSLEVAVVEPDVVGRLTAEHHVELGEAEGERVVAIDQRHANRVRDRLREPGRELQSAERGPEDHNVLAHRRTLHRPGLTTSTQHGERSTCDGTTPSVAVADESLAAPGEPVPVGTKTPRDAGRA